MERQVLAIQRVEGATVQFIDELPGWNRALPAALVVPAGSVAQRRATLLRFVSRALAVHPELIEIEYAADRPPIVGQPLNSGLYLSTASRAGLAVLGAATAPTGVDVELVEEGGEIPWNVLHPAEAEMLRALAGRPQAMAFARLWSLKECYLKSLGVGLGREPASFAVRFRDSELAEIDDPVASSETADARTTWRSAGGVWSAVSAVVLVRQRH
jgi:4'-phosphopantetheinyl transferase